MPQGARPLAAAALAIALAGCANLEASGPACRATKATELPARIAHGQLVVPVRLDGKTAALLVDTGAEGSMVTPETADRLRLPRTPRRTTTIHGTGGTVVSANADVRHFEVGTIALDDQSLAVGPVPAAQRFGIDGLLGADWLGGFDVDIDVPHQRLALWRVRGCDASFDPLPGTHFAVPMIRTPRGRVLIPVRVDQTRMLAYLDTGAMATIVTASAAAHLGVTDAALSRDPGGFGLGVDLRRLGFRWHRFSEFAIGPEQFRNVALPVSDVQVRVAGVLLGADYLARHRVWISQSTRRVLIEPAR